MVTALSIRQAGGSRVGRRWHVPWPATLTLTVTPIWTAIWVKVSVTEGAFSGQTLRAEVTYQRAGAGISRRGLDPIHPSDKDGDVLTELRGCCYNLREGSEYSLCVTVGVYDSAGNLTDTYRQYIAATTLNSSVATGTSTTYYFDASVASDSGDGLSLAAAKKFLGSLDTSMGPGKSILFGPAFTADNTVTSRLRYQDTSDADPGNPATGSRGGSSTAWVRIAPASGTSQVRGYAALNGGWELEDGTDDVWKKTTFATTSRIEKVYDVTAGRMLPMLYANLTTSVGGVKAIKDETMPGSHFIAHASDPAQQILYVRKITAPTVEPEDGELIGAKQWALQFNDLNYLVIEDIDFFMCGQMKSNGTNDTVGLRVTNCNYVIFRRCNLDHARVLFEGCSYVLIDDCTFTQTSVWDYLMDEAVNDPYDSDNGWSWDKNNRRDAVGLYLADTKNVEVRNSSFSMVQVLLNTGAGLNVYNTTLENLYVHGCDAEKLGDEFLEGDIDTISGLVIADCTVNGTHNFTSFTPATGGVIWTVNNLIREPLFTVYKAGSVTDYTQSNCRIEHVNNTVVMSRARVSPDDEANGAIYFLGHQGNAHWTNCVWVLNSPTNNFFSVGTHSNLSFTNCVIYNSEGVTGGWLYGVTTYATPAAMDAAQATISMDGITTDVNPYPAGFDGAVNSDLPRCTDYPGVTDELGELRCGVCSVQSAA